MEASLVKQFESNSENVPKLEIEEAKKIMINDVINPIDKKEKEEKEEKEEKLIDYKKIILEEINRLSNNLSKFQKNFDKFEKTLHCSLTLLVEISKILLNGENIDYKNVFLEFQDKFIKDYVNQACSFFINKKEMSEKLYFGPSEQNVYQFYRQEKRQFPIKTFVQGKRYFVDKHTMNIGYEELVQLIKDEYPYSLCPIEHFNHILNKKCCGYCGQLTDHQIKEIYDPTNILKCSYLGQSFINWIEELAKKYNSTVQDIYKMTIRGDGYFKEYPNSAIWNKELFEKYLKTLECSFCKEKLHKKDDCQKLMEIKCTNCEELGHTPKYCPKDKPTCDICNKSGHETRFCKFRQTHKCQYCNKQGHHITNCFKLKEKMAN